MKTRNRFIAAAALVLWCAFAVPGGAIQESSAPPVTNAVTSVQASTNSLTGSERAPVPSRPAPGENAQAPNPQRGMKLLASATLAFVCIIVLLIGIVMLRSLRR